MISTSNDTTTLSLKTKKQVKELAQLRSRQLGIPLGTLINAFLRNLGQTGEVHFSVAEPVSPKMAQAIDEMRTEIAKGDTFGPFTIQESIEFLNSNTADSLGINER
jgi:antitoxin component of RelBE/YafQ-DinJ toxin-antitoxin module